MSNLQSAKSAIEAELSHAKEGVIFYQLRVEALENALLQIANLGAIDLSENLNVKKGRGLKQSAKYARTSRGMKGETRTSSSHKALPFTGGDYWVNLISEQPKTGPEILRAAVGKLDFSPSKEQIKKLAARMTSALGMLLKENQIQDQGAGRQRRYFKSL